MSKQQIQLNQSPHELEIVGHRELGTVVLQFEPELYGDAMRNAYAEYQKKLEAEGLGAEQDDNQAVDLDKIGVGIALLREFLTEFMLDHSKELFSTLELPDRVLLSMSQAVTGFYSGERPTGTSNDSTPTSATQSGGSRSTGTSQRKGATRKPSRPRKS